MKDKWQVILFFLAPWLIVGLALLVNILAGCQKYEPPGTLRPPPPPASSDARWNAAALRPAALIRLDKLCERYQRTQHRYDHLAMARRNGVPQPVIFGIHYREGDNSFATNVANGDSLQHRTRNAPVGRIPGVPPPYTFDQAGEDALYVADKLDRTNWHAASTALRGIENFNGGGYRAKGLPSPYVWSGTDQYARGKYVSDGKFSPTTVDSQLGVAAILKRMQQRHVSTPF